MPEIEFETSQVGGEATFRESVVVENLPNGTRWSGGEIGTWPGSDREAQFQALQDECDRLRDRVAELERELRAR